MIVGQIEGNDVIYDKSEDSIFCKNLKVYAKDIIEAFESSIDREIVPNTSETKLIMRKFSSRVRLGCFNLTIDESKKLIKNIKNARNKK